MWSGPSSEPAQVVFPAVEKWGELIRQNFFFHLLYVKQNHLFGLGPCVWKSSGGTNLTLYSSVSEPFGASASDSGGAGTVPIDDIL
jgi:hypothetical protein